MSQNIFETHYLETKRLCWLKENLCSTCGQWYGSLSGCPTL